MNAQTCQDTRRRRADDAGHHRDLQIGHEGFGDASEVDRLLQAEVGLSARERLEHPLEQVFLKHPCSNGAG